MKQIPLILQPKQFALGQLIYATGPNVATWIGGGGARAGGKALAIDTPIPTPQGWQRIVELLPGDEVFAEDGTVCRVVGISEVMMNAALRLKFDDGESIIADREHQWHTHTKAERVGQRRRTEVFRSNRRLKRTKRGKGLSPETSERNMRVAEAQRGSLLKPIYGTIRTSAEIADTLKYKNEANHSIENAGALVLSAKELPIDPYLLGFWLGDGRSRSGELTCADPEIIEHIRVRGREVYKLKTRYQWSVPNLTAELRSIGLIENKHIPALYLRSSIDQRLWLLRGLLDSDGYCRPSGQVEFCNINYRLAENVLELARSLGLKASIRSKRAMLYGQDCGICWTVTWKSPMPVFYLKRKATRLASKVGRGNQRFIVGSESVGLQAVCCISVDSPSRLYLAGKAMIPTHNSGGLRRIMLDRRMQRPGTAGVIVRRTYKDVNENHIQKYQSEFPELQKYWRATDLEYRLENGSRLCFRHAENQQAVDQAFWGPEWYDIFVDQAEQFSEKELTIIKSSNRWPGAPMNDCKTSLFFNPGGVGTEFLRRIFHQKRFLANENPASYHFVHLFGWDNYVWFESLGISPKEFYALPDGVRAGEDCPAGADGDRDSGYTCCRFHLFIRRTAEGQKLNALPPSLRAGHLLGSFDSFAGQYFAGVWDESKLILTAQQQANLIQPWWQRAMAHDDGFVHHAALVWGTIGKVSPKLFKEVFGVEIAEAVTVVVVYRSMVESEVEPGELVRRARAATSVDEVRTLSRYFLSVDAWEKNSHGHSVAEEIDRELSRQEKIQHEGKELIVTFPHPEQADNARIGGWRYMYAMMKKTADVLDGKMNVTRDNDDYEADGSGGYSKDTPLLFIGGQCQDVIEAIPMAIRDDVHAGRHEDIIKLPTKADDTLDAIRYLLKSVLRAKMTPFPVQAAEKRQEMALAGRSLTEQAIVLKKMEYERGHKRPSRKGSFR